MMSTKDGARLSHRRILAGSDYQFAGDSWVIEVYNDFTKQR